MSWKKRALRTFAQAFCGVLVTQLVPFTSLVFADGGITSDSVIKACIVQILAPAVAAGAAALMNMNTEGENHEQ